MAEKEPVDDDGKGESGEKGEKVIEAAQPVAAAVEEPVVIEEEEEEEREEEEMEEEEKARRFRRCERRKKVRIPEVEVLKEPEEQENQEDEDEEEEDEESEEDEETVSEYESVFSSVPFEWENEIYEFLDLCDPGTMDEPSVKEPVKMSYDVYGQTCYLNTCNDLNVPPIVRFYNSLKTSEADLTFHGIDTKQMYAICKALEINPTVESLTLKGNHLSSGCCQSLNTLLAKNSVITVLDLSGCKIGPDGAQSLARGLLSNEGIKELLLSKCYIKDDGMNYLATSLKNNYHVEKLILSWNNLSVDAAEALGTMLYYNNCISHLDLDNNDFYDPACMKKLCKGLTFNTSVTYLTMKWNALSSSQTGDALSQFLRRNSTINCLDLSDNRLDGESVKPLRKGLAGCSSLEILRLARNPLTSADVEYLLPGVKASARLKLVDLQETWVRKEFVKSLNKIKLIKDVEVLLGGVYSDYQIAGPDYPALILKRAQFEGMKPKKPNARREFGNLLFALGDEPVTPDYFMEEVAKFKAKISDELFPELIKQFTLTKGNLVDVVRMREKYLSLFPNFKPPEVKKAKVEDGGAEEEASVQAEEMGMEEYEGTEEGVDEGVQEG